MVYKRYVKKDGKVYGPYYQSSKKENGKVVTNYVGKKPVKENSSGAITKFAVLLLVVAGLFIFVYFNNPFTGSVILSSDNSSNGSISNSSVNNLSNVTNVSGDYNNLTGVSENISYENLSNVTGSETNISVNQSLYVNQSVESLNETNVSGSVNHISNISSDENTSQVSPDINLKVDTTQYPVVVGMPVKWKKTVSVDVASNVSIEIPKDADNVTVYKIQETSQNKNVKSASSFSITGNAVRGNNAESASGILDFFKNFFLKLFGAITGRVVDTPQSSNTVNVTINENATNYEIEYQTPAPVATEQNTSSGKMVTISSDYHYQNILAYSELPNPVSIDKIKLYHYDENTGAKSLSDFQAYDSDGNLIYGSDAGSLGFENVSVKDLVNSSSSSKNKQLVSFITWVVPHLSNQTYEIVINISNAEHLDSNKNFVSDIYDSVKSQDGVWSEEIPNGDYVRTTFEKNLTNKNDITVYARGDGTIEIYNENGQNKLSEINVDGEGLYKTYLTSLTGSQNVFDLKTVSSSGGIYYDYIVDPFNINSSTGTGTNTTKEVNFTHLSLSDSSLVAYYPFDVQEGSNNVTYDYSGNNNDGNLTNGPVFNSTGGVYGGDYQFDGINQYMGTSGLDWVNFCSVNCSISLWMKPTGIVSASYEASIGSVGTSNNGIFWEGTGTNNIYFRIGGSGANQMSKSLSSNHISNNQWNHIVVTKNGTTGRIFVNDVDLGYGTVGTTPTSGNFIVGALASNNFFSNGSIDEVMVFNRTLSLTEVLQIYNSTYSRFYPNGEINFTGLNLGTNNTVNVSVPNCQTLNGSLLYGKINSGSYQQLSGCSLNNYSVSGDLTSANLTLKLTSTSGNYFYSPLVVGNVSLNDYYVASDTTAPSITIRSPSNNSYASSNVKFDASISDSSGSTYSFINKSLVGYWTFDSVNSTGVFDDSGNNNFGSFGGTNFGTSNLSTGQFGNGINFDGVDDYVDLGNGDTSLEGSQAFTIGIWLYKGADTFSGFPGIFGRGSSSQRTPWIFGTSGQIHFTGGFETDFGVNDCNVQSPNLNINSWNFLVLRWNGSSCWFTVNGVDGSLDATSGTVLGNTDGNNYIGKIGGYATFNGSIDDMMIFNRSLSSDEIKALYNSSAQKFNVSYALPLVGVNEIPVVAVDKYENQNITTLSITNDLNSPSITFESPTLDNGSTISSTDQTITANISDDSSGNTSSFIDFDKSLIGYWSFDSYNSTGVYDNSTYGNFGTFQGTGFGTSNITQGVRGNGLTFDGVNDYVDLGTSLSSGLDTTKNWTISLWVYPINPSVDQCAFADATSSTSRICIGVDSTGVFWGGFYDGSSYTRAQTSVILNSWSNLVLTNSNKTIHFYVNGVEYSGGAGAILAGIAGSRIGSRTTSSGFFNGSIDETMIFNRSLSSSEVSAIYNSQANKFNVTFSNLSDGQHNYTLYAIDSAGNVNTSNQNFVVSLDSVAPNLTINSPLNETYSLSSILFNVTASDDSGISECVYSLDGLVNISMTNIAGTDYYNYTNSSMVEGSHNVIFYCNDSYGNTNTSDTIYFGVDTTAPTLDLNKNSSQLEYGQDVININWSASDSNLDSVIFNVTLLNGSLVYSSLNSSGDINLTSLNLTSLGVYTINLYANDSSGNENSTSDNFSVNDTVSPQVSIVLPTTGEVFSSSSITFQVTTNENSTCNYSIDSWITNNSMSPDSNGTIHEASATLNNGDYTALYSCADLSGNTNSSQNVSFSVSVSSSSGSSSSGGGSSGGGGGSSSTSSSVAPSDFKADVTTIEKTLALNRIELGQIKIDNNKNVTRTFTARVEVLNSIISFDNDSITIDGDSSGEFNYRMTPPNNPGTYTGKIIISSNGVELQIPVVVNVKTEKSLYDIILTIPKSQKVLKSGDTLSTQIDLLQMGIKEKMDVTLNYAIKDFSGKVYLTQTETIAVEDQKTLQKEFDTHDLPDGDYVLSAELIYPDGVAVASSQFKVGSSLGFSNNLLIKILALVVLAVLVIVIFFSIKRYRRLAKSVKR